MKDRKDWIADTVHDALNEDVLETDPVAFELRCLWNDLDQAIRSAADGRWSVRCDNVVERIVRLTRHLGRPAPAREVPMTLLAHGVYRQVHEAMGVEAPVTDEEMARAEEHADQQTEPTTCGAQRASHDGVLVCGRKTGHNPPHRQRIVKFDTVVTYEWGVRDYIHVTATSKDAFPRGRYG